MIRSNAPTRYEISARHKDGRAFLVCYAAGSPSLRRLVSAVNERGVAIGKATGLALDSEFAFVTKPRPEARCGDWFVGYTGRTQREIKNSGGRVAALPFVGE